MDLETLLQTASILPSEFYQQSSLDVAEALLGKIIISQKEGVVTGGIITETEAYPSWDAASHAFRKTKPTPRTAIQYEQGGLLYMYLIMGLHHMTSIVTGQNGEADVVFIRSLEPLIGIDSMVERRGVDPSKVTNGPGRLSAAMKLTVKDNGIKVYEPDSAVKLFAPHSIPEFEISRAPRINLGVHGATPAESEEAIAREWRYYIRGSKFLSIPDKKNK